MEIEGLEWTYESFGFEWYKIINMPSVNVLVDEEGIIIEAEIDEEYNNEIRYDLLHWWSDWAGDEVGYDDILIAGLYAVKEFPSVEMYVDVENERILEVWAICDDE